MRMLPLKNGSFLSCSFRPSMVVFVERSVMTTDKSKDWIGQRLPHPSCVLEQDQLVVNKQQVFCCDVFRSLSFHFTAADFCMGFYSSPALYTKGELVQFFSHVRNLTPLSDFLFGSAIHCFVFPFSILILFSPNCLY